MTETDREISQVLWSEESICENDYSNQSTIGSPQSTSGFFHRTRAKKFTGRLWWCYFFPWLHAYFWWFVVKGAGGDSGSKTKVRQLEVTH